MTKRFEETAAGEVFDSVLSKIWRVDAGIWEAPHHKHLVDTGRWRMASLSELMTLPNRGSKLPTAAPTWLRDYNKPIWASEVYARNQNKAWALDMHTGELVLKRRWRSFGALYLREPDVETHKYLPTKSCTLAEVTGRLKTFFELSTLNQQGLLEPGQYWVEADLATKEKGFGLTFSTGLPFACGRTSPSIRCLCLV